jgi:predicted Zn-dependent peptidase
MKSVSAGIWVAVGGRHEHEEHCGISHFLEHLLFKGTKTRTAQRLTEEVEGVGGFINARKSCAKLRNTRSARTNSA